MKNTLFVLFCGAFLVNATPLSPPAPRYLSVRDFQKCLKSGSYGAADAWCMPESKPADCCEISWKELCDIAKVDKVPAPCRSYNPPPSPPKYLGVKNYEKCVAVLPNGSTRCLPNRKPADCCEDSWNQLNGFTGADKLKSCPETYPAPSPLSYTPPLPTYTPPPPPPPPKYMEITGWEKCLGTVQDASGNSFMCISNKRPHACCEDSWRQLNALNGAKKFKPCAPPPPTYTPPPPPPPPPPPARPPPPPPARPPPPPPPRPIPYVPLVVAHPVAVAAHPVAMAHPVAVAVAPHCGH